MLGYSDLLTNYEIDPTVPEEGITYPQVPMTNKRRPGSEYVQDLTRWDDPSTAQTLSRPQEAGQRVGDLSPVVEKKKITPTKPILTSSSNLPPDEEKVDSMSRSRVATKHHMIVTKKQAKAVSQTNQPTVSRPYLNVTITSQDNQRMVPAKPPGEPRQL